MKVLFVCDGNICRSPLAACYLRHLASRFEMRDLVVDSAGLLGIKGAPAAPLSIEVARDGGMDLTGHRSRGVTPEDMRWADWVFAMTSAQLETLAARHPVGGERRLLLRAFEDGPAPKAGARELNDPVALPIEAYREAFAIMTTCVDHFVAHLRQAP